MANIQKFSEERLPYILAVAVAAIALKHPIPLPENYLADFIGSSLTMCVVALGFMATSMSVLISYRTTRVARELRDTNVMARLVNYLREAIFWTIIWLLVNLLLYFDHSHWLLAAWATLATLALSCYVRAVSLLSQLILK